MTELKTWAASPLLWLAATLPALAQQDRAPPPGDAEIPWMLVIITAAALLIVIGAIVSKSMRKPKETVIIARDERE